MNLKTFLTINAVMFIPFGLGMLFLPSLIFPMLEVHLDPDGLVMASTVGSMLLSFGVMCWLAREATEPSIALAALLFGNLLFHAIDSVLTFRGAFGGTMNSLGFVFSSMHFVFALGFLHFYVQFRKAAG